MVFMKVEKLQWSKEEKLLVAAFDAFLQKVAYDVWVLKTLFQLVYLIFMHVPVWGKSINCCFGFSNQKSCR